MTQSLDRQEPRVMITRRANLPIVSSTLAPSRESFFCARPWTGFEVEENGEVKMCCWAKKIYGNVNEQTIEDMWNGRAIKEFRLKMARGEWADICKPHCPVIAGYTKDTPHPKEPLNDTFSSNLERNLAEIAGRKLELESLPRFWKIAHSTLCNLDCVMCYQDRKSKHQLPASFYHEMKQYYPNIQELLLIGGEPLVIKEIRRLMNEFPTERCPDTKLALITNGTIFDDNTMALAARVSLLGVSLDRRRKPRDLRSHKKTWRAFAYLGWDQSVEKAE